MNPKAIKTINEVSCPSHCSATDKGCFFEDVGSQYACTRCSIKVRKTFMGYNITPQDLHEMLQFKCCQGERQLVSNRDGVDKQFHSAIMLDERFQVKLAPKLRNKELTEEICPSCNSKLHLNTNHNGTRWFGCSGYPSCKYTRKAPSLEAAVPEEGKPVLDPFGGVTQPMESAQITLSPAEIPDISPEASDMEPVIFQSKSEYVPPVEEDKYKNIPEFVRQMLKLDLPEVTPRITIS